MTKKADPLNKKQRSYCMSQVKSSNTKGELLLRNNLSKFGFKFKVNVEELPGKPDIIFPEVYLAIFIDGDFWHGRNRKSWLPGMSDFWTLKIINNVKRDRKVNRILKADGWEVVRIWEKDLLRNSQSITNAIIILILLLKKNLDFDSN